MSDKERFLRISYYVERLDKLFSQVNFGDSGYRAARLIDALRWLSLPIRNPEDLSAFEYLVKSGMFSDSDLVVKEAKQ